MHEIELTGLNGSNLLGYMAALGTLRVLAIADPEGRVHMKWTRSGAWLPVLVSARLKDTEDIVQAVEARVCGERTINRAWTIGKDLTLSREEFRAQLDRLEDLDLQEADFLAAFGSEAYGSGPKKEQMSDTEFRTMGGAGHQHFLGFMRELAERTTGEQVRRALFELWDYEDDRPSMRWDPADYRPHALRAEDPSGDPIRTMRAANRLAVEALPLFPTVACDAKTIRTIGFCDRDGKTEITWPIWSEPLELDTVKVLLASVEIQEDKPQRRVMTSRRIDQVFRARRFTEGKYRNFSPARALL